MKPLKPLKPKTLNNNHRRKFLSQIFIMMVIVSYIAIVAIPNLGYNLKTQATEKNPLIDEVTVSSITSNNEKSKVAKKSDALSENSFSKKKEKKDLTDNNKSEDVSESSHVDSKESATNEKNEISEITTEEHNNSIEKDVSDVESTETFSYKEDEESAEEPVSVDETNETTETIVTTITTANDSSVLTRSGGVNYFNGHKETWYSERVLPGNGLDIPGRHTDESGLVRDADNFICVASSDLPKGSIVETSLGIGKVYDCGCASGTIDIYTNW